jgi:hypothetical protein
MDKKALIKALRDTAQSASNTIASGVSAPVDLIAAGLRKMGVPVPENALGGSRWMEDVGLTVPVQEGIPKTVGETFGMIFPMAATAKAPQIAAGANRAIENAMVPNYLNKQAGVINFPNLTTKQEVRTAIRLMADDLANKLREKGFQATVEHSGSAAGPSSYVKVFDPQTGRFIVNPARISDHSKGAFNSQFVHEIQGEYPNAIFDDFLKIADDMRAMGPSKMMLAEMEKQVRKTK